MIGGRNWDCSGIAFVSTWFCLFLLSDLDGALALVLFCGTHCWHFLVRASPGWMVDLEGMDGKSF
jgi:hypothetical protein